MWVQLNERSNAYLEIFFSCVAQIYSSKDQLAYLNLDGSLTVVCVRSRYLDFFIVSGEKPGTYTMQFISFEDKCLWSCHWAPLKSVWLPFLHSLPSGIYTHGWDLPEPSLLHPEQSQLSQPRGPNKERCSPGLDTYIQTRKNWSEIWKLEAALAAVAVWPLESQDPGGYQREGAGRKAGPQAYMSGERTSTSLEICLEESHGIWLWKEEGSRRAGWWGKVHSNK